MFINKNMWWWMGRVNCSCRDSGFTTVSSAEWCILLGFSDFSNTVTQRESLKVAKSSVIQWLMLSFLIYKIHCLNYHSLCSERRLSIYNCTRVVGTPWRRQWHPTPVLLPGKSHGRRSPVGCSPWGHSESDRTELLHFHFSPSCIGEGNGNPLQCSCLENPRDRGAWWAAIYGVA